MGGQPFELVVSKLRRPSVRPGTVRRSLLIERLARGDPCPVVSVVASAGYGKTTLLSQWAERNGRASAWVSLDERDNDPTTRACRSVRTTWRSCTGVPRDGRRVCTGCAAQAVQLGELPGAVRLLHPGLVVLPGHGNLCGLEARQEPGSAGPAPELDRRSHRPGDHRREPDPGLWLIARDIYLIVT